MTGPLPNPRSLINLCFVIFSAWSLHAQDKCLCVTVDDLPTVTYGVGGDDYKLQLTRQLVTTFNSRNVPAIGFVNEGKLHPKGKLDSSMVSALELWLDRGLMLGNHTYAHTSYHRSSFEEFTKDMILGEEVTRQLMQARGQTLRFFRHPYLHIGETKSKADSLARFLSDKGYITSPVTLDAEDYEFAKRYAQALRKGDSVRARSIGEAYVQYTREMTLYYEKLSETLFGRQICQSLLIHANQLNADYFGQLHELFDSMGYRFVSQEEVLRDEAYQSPVTKFGTYGISWLERWALSQGKARELMSSSPKLPTFR